MQNLIKKPSWYMKYWEEKNVTEEQIAAWKKESEECDAFNNELFKNWRQKYDELIKLAKEVYGLGSNELKYIELHRPVCRAPYNFYTSVECRMNKFKEDRAAKARKTDLEKNNQILVEEAIVWLQGRGLKLGVDFNLNNCVGVAIDIAVEERKKELVENLNNSGKFVQFGGSENCNDCKGWDGVSRRCQCGNRRVSWAADHSGSFKDVYVYPEVY